jgi:hypothetical protein
VQGAKESSAMKQNQRATNVPGAQYHAVATNRLEIQKRE